MEYNFSHYVCVAEGTHRSKEWESPKLFILLLLEDKSETSVSKNPKMPVSRSNNFHHIQRAIVYCLCSSSWGNLAFLGLFWACAQSMLMFVSENHLPPPVGRWCSVRCCKPCIRSELQKSTRKKGFYCALGSIWNSLPLRVKSLQKAREMAVCHQWPPAWQITVTFWQQMVPRPDVIQECTF